MFRAVKIKGRGTEMYFVLFGRVEGIIRPGLGQAKKKKPYPNTSCLIVPVGVQISNEVHPGGQNICWG